MRAANHQRRARRHSPVTWVALALSMVVAAFLGAYLVLPGARDRLITEDGIIETATAGVFLAAAAGGTWAIRTATTAPAVYWLVPGFAAFGFLDEVSFGARIFQFPLPVVDGMEVDSFHDVFDLADRFAGDIGIERLQIAAVLGALGLLALGWMLREGRSRRLATWLIEHPPLLLGSAAVALLLAGIALDLLAGSGISTLLEETAEFCAAGLLGIAAIVIHQQHRDAVTWRDFEGPDAEDLAVLGGRR